MSSASPSHELSQRYQLWYNNQGSRRMLIRRPIAFTTFRFVCFITNSFSLIHFFAYACFFQPFVCIVRLHVLNMYLFWRNLIILWSPWYPPGHIYFWPCLGQTVIFITSSKREVNIIFQKWESFLKNKNIFIFVAVVVDCLYMWYVFMYM